MGKKSWHLDKKVTVGLILTLLAQAVGLVVWATRLDSRVAFTEKAMEAVEDRTNRLNMDVQGLNERLARMEANMDNQTALLREVRAAIIKK